MSSINMNQITFKSRMSFDKIWNCFERCSENELQFSRKIVVDKVLGYANILVLSQIERYESNIRVCNQIIHAGVSRVKSNFTNNRIGWKIRNNFSLEERGREKKTISSRDFRKFLLNFGAGICCLLFLLVFDQTYIFWLECLPYGLPIFRSSCF